MSTSDTITLVQAFAALVTCVLLLIYIVETNRLRRQAHEQSRMQREEIDLAKQQLTQVLLRERLLFRPDLQWRGGFSGQNEAKWDFENLGADVCNLRWSGPEGVSIEHEPRHMIRTFDRGSIKINGKAEQLAFPCRLMLTYNNRFGETCNQVFEIPIAGQQPKEIAAN